jgi:hypothetical protein
VSTSMLMQVDGYEKPLPPRPAPLALTLRINPDQGPASAPARMPAASPMMMVDTREGDKNGDGAGEGEFPPTSDSTLRTTPTSLTCFETTESQRQVLQRRPNRALTPPQVRRRPSITDELEEAVRFYHPPPYMCNLHLLRRGKRPRWPCCRLRERTDFCAVRDEGATRS